MKDIFKELLSRYQEKRNELYEKNNPPRPMWKELIKPSKTPKAEEIIDQEIDLYRTCESEIEDIQKLRNRSITLDQWSEVTHFLKIHNERLSSQIDNSTTVSAIFAALSVVWVILANNWGPQHWIIFAITAWISFQVFFSRIEKRHELARNREILTILEQYIKKKS